MEPDVVAYIVFKLIYHFYHNAWSKNHCRGSTLMKLPYFIASIEFKGNEVFCLLYIEIAKERSVKESAPV